MSWLGITGDAVLILLGVLVARAAISTARTPQGAAAWVVFLVSFPLLALPAFALFGSVARLNRRTDDRHKPLSHGATGGGRLAELHAITLTEAVPGNDLHLLVDGRATFDAMFEAIDAAEHEIVLQSYIVRADAVGLALRDRLIAAAGRGVKVRMLCDMLGSAFLGLRYGRALARAGVELRGTAGPYRKLGRIGLNFRNHRKTLVVDGRTGFIGGINLAREYVDGGKAFASWRDTHLRVEGPMTRHLRDLFAADWKAVTGEALPPPPELPGLPEPHENSVTGLVTGFGPTDSMERGSLLLCGLVALARRRLWIATPYLVPHADLVTALQLAVLRGVDVRFLVPAPSDNLLAWYASRGYGLSQAGLGIDVYEYEPGFMHQKVMLIDDDIASVGTVNIDIRSALLNFEVTALVEDAGFAARIEAMLTADFARARRLEPPGAWHVRLLAPVARLFAPLL